MGLTVWISLVLLLYAMSHTKLIAERLKPFLATLISKEQGGFVGGRHILDGVVISSEAIHSMATSK